MACRSSTGLAVVASALAIKVVWLLVALALGLTLSIIEPGQPAVDNDH
jgi:hypothetical protein